MEQRKRKIQQMKEEIFRLSKKKKSILFNVFNISDKEEFDKKMKADFPTLEYKVEEEDKEEDCLIVSVEYTMADDILYIDGCKIKNNNIDLYLDEEQKISKKKKETTQKTGTWDEPTQPTKAKKEAPPKAISKPLKTGGKKRGRLQNNN